MLFVLNIWNFKFWELFRIFEYSDFEHSKKLQF